ncbi:Nucleotide-alpha-beta plait [Cordyceps militaris]|uniref:Nucleotide-alpha-beta plait n=1 Tax=Cordyceps militaris TaxID=73501 RepID=A0A2H4S9Y5_CORMI|nr:Nucleotide-alpha-beta plait [Cordyceps militaris]
MSTRPPSRVVFVGNIPYGLSEEQITDIFSDAGKVERFRLVYDSETGRPKGFGFAEYPDTDSASSAVRNLNDYEIMGRKLRVDFSHEQKASDDDYTPNAGTTSNGTSHTAQPSSLPPLPPGKDIPPGLTCTDAISRTLNTLPPAQLLDILTQMKTLATTDPQRAAELLQQAPQLAYAVFQALLLMGLVSPEAIQSVIEPGAPSAPTVPQQQQQQPASYGIPAGYPQAQATNTPPVAPAAAAGGQDTDGLMRALMELPQAQIDMLPESEKQQVMALRAAFVGQGRR